jgi:hypothetical protein
LENFVQPLEADGAHVYQTVIGHLIRKTEIAITHT